MKKRFALAVSLFSTVSMLSTLVGPAGAAPERFDWTAIADHTYRGYDIGPCGGEAPIACVRQGERTIIGFVEHFSAPVATFDYLDDVHGPRRRIRRVAQEFIQTFREDRETTCRDLRYRAIGPRPAEVAGKPGFVWGFALVDNGVIVEKTLDYGIVQNGAVHLLTINAADDGACLPSDGGFSIAGLHDFRRSYRILAARSYFGTP